MTESTPTVSSKAMPTPLLLGLGAFFAVVFAVNGVLIYQASTTWNGMATRDHYQKGLVYNNVLAAQSAQDALGWQARLATTADHGTVQLTLSLQDREGRPVTGAKVSGLLYRPVQEGMDQGFAMAESTTGGYQARLTVPLPGWWEARLLVTTPTGEFRYVERFQTSSATVNGGGK